MKVAILSKDLRDGEDVSEYAKSLAGYLVEKGHKASIIAFDDGANYTVPDGVDVERVPLHFDADNVYNWAMMLNNELKAGVNNLIDGSEFDIVHANDWATVPGGITVSKHLEIPLAVTLHSTENQRGFGGDSSSMISEMEWKAGFEAEKVFVTNEDTKNSVLFDLDVPEDKIEMVDPYQDGWKQHLLGIYRSMIGDGS